MRRALTCTCTCLYNRSALHIASQDGLDNRSALHIASQNGLESAVSKLLSLGADAALKDKVRACSHRNTCMCSVHVCIQRAFAARER